MVMSDSVNRVLVHEGGPPRASDAPGGPTGQATTTGQVNPAALTVEQVARLLTAAGARCADVETIRRHIAAGAPVSGAGTINLVHYMAWLVREVSHGEE